MKKINYLKENNKISLIAPSFGCTTEPYYTRLLEAIKNLQEDGFELDLGENIFLAKHKARSSTSRSCAKEFMKAYESDSKAIISVGGGEIMCEILPYIDFKKINKLPHKFFMGFSDNTNLTYTLATICEVPTIYGVNAPNFAFKPYDFDTKDSLDLLMGKIKKVCGYPYWERNKKDSLDPLEKTIYNEIKKIRVNKNQTVSIEGRLLGGCLDCLINLCGTKFDKTNQYLEKYREDGFIWFLEACDLNPLGIQRALFQLRNSGWFKYCKGFLLGRPLCYGESMLGITHYKAIKEALHGLNVPIVMDCDLGHFKPSMPIITGVKAKVKVENNLFEIEYLD